MGHGQELSPVDAEAVVSAPAVSGEHPHFTMVNSFRATHSAGLVKLGHVAIDGTKMKASTRR